MHKRKRSVISSRLFFGYQVLALFPSSQDLEVTWSSVVKIGQSLYREGPGKDPFRPDQKTPVKNFFLAGSYTKQVTLRRLNNSHNAWLLHAYNLRTFVPASPPEKKRL